MTKSSAVLLIVTLLGSVAAASADESAKRANLYQAPPITFEALDKNADQQISRTEAGRDRKLSDGFAYADTNADGYLSKAEFVAHTQSGRDPS